MHIASEIQLISTHICLGGNCLRENLRNLVFVCNNNLFLLLFIYDVMNLGERVLFTECRNFLCRRCRISCSTCWETYCVQKVTGKLCFHLRCKWDHFEWTVRVDKLWNECLKWGHPYLVWLFKLSCSENKIQRAPSSQQPDSNDREHNSHQFRKCKNQSIYCSVWR